MSKETTASGGIGFFGLLGLAFIILKLCKVIKWSWLWVLSPIWIPAAIGIILIITLTILTVIKEKKSYETRN